MEVSKMMVRASNSQQNERKTKKKNFLLLHQHKLKYNDKEMQPNFDYYCNLKLYVKSATKQLIKSVADNF